MDEKRVLQIAKEMTKEYCRGIGSEAFLWRLRDTAKKLEISEEEALKFFNLMAGELGIAKKRKLPLRLRCDRYSGECDPNEKYRAGKSCTGCGG